MTKQNNLSTDQIVKILKQSGSKKITNELLKSDADGDEFLEQDGTINLVNYLAWMLKMDNK